MNQPITKSRYRVFYDYIAPKTNERITLTYNYDRLISDLTISLNKNKYIGTDILVKRSNPVMVDVIMSIVVSNEFQLQDSFFITQNVQDAISNFIRYKRNIIDSSDLINLAYSVTGVDRCRVIFFNKKNKIGSVLSLKPEKNEYFMPNKIVISLESR